MMIDEAIELMKNEKACIMKADTCDRNCTKCELLRETKDLLSAYDMAIQALERTKWIPCSERLPKNDDDVIITTGMGIYIGWFDADNHTWQLNDDYIVGIVAWMPLPIPYKGEKK